MLEENQNIFPILDKEKDKDSILYPREEKEAENKKNFINFSRIEQGPQPQSESWPLKFKIFLVLLIAINIILIVTLGIILFKKYFNSENSEKNPEDDKDKDKLFVDDKVIYVFGHKNPDTDTIVSAIAMAYLERQITYNNNVIACRLGELNRETEFVMNYFNASLPLLINNVSGADEVILVDHNTPTQGPDDIRDAKVIKLIDHHAISDFETNYAIYIYTKPVGCTCTIIYELYKENKIPITKTLAGLMMSAIISDTVLLKSSMTTNEDKETIEELAEISGVDYKEYGMEMLMKGTDLSGYTDEDLIVLDSKNYVVNGYNLQISCINAVDYSILDERKNGLLLEIEKFNNENDIDLFIFAVMDIINMDCTVIVKGEQSQAVEEAFDVTLINDEAFLKGVNSRKKDIYPMISQVLNTYPEKE